MPDRIALHSRSLAKDGAVRAEVRAICVEGVIDYSGASWGEWLTLEMVAEECAALSERRPTTEPRASRSEPSDV